MNRLPKDITVIELKEIAKIKQYQKLIQYHSKTNALQFDQLSEYLVKR